MTPPLEKSFEMRDNIAYRLPNGLLIRSKTHEHPPAFITIPPADPMRVAVLGALRDWWK